MLYNLLKLTYFLERREQDVFIWRILINFWPVTAYENIKEYSVFSLNLGDLYDKLRSSS
jgi:hypothetical protein